MAYYVLGPNNDRYGPADLATLNMWIAEGRIAQTTHLQDEATGNVVAAGNVPGLQFTSTHTVTAPPGAASPYFRPPAPQQAPVPFNQAGFQPTMTNTGKNDLNFSFLLAFLSPFLSFFCFFGFAAAACGIGLGIRAKNAGQNLGNLAIACNVVALVIAVAVKIFAAAAIFR